MGSVARWVTKREVLVCKECGIRQEWEATSKIKAALILIMCECGRLEFINIKNDPEVDLVEAFRNG